MQTTVDRVLSLPRTLKRALALGTDIFLCALAIALAYYLRLGYWVPLKGTALLPVAVTIAVAIPLFISFGLYRAIFRYSGTASLAPLALAVGVYGAVFSTVFTFVGIVGVPRTIGLIAPLLMFILIGGSRVVATMALGGAYRKLLRSAQLPRVLIYGAGSAGRQLASAIRAGREMHLVGFVDDNPGLWKATMNGARVFAPDRLDQLIAVHRVTDVLLAIPSASRPRRSEIVGGLRSLGLHVRTLPGLMDLASGRVGVADLKELEIEDLLGRPAVPPDAALLAANIKGKTVMVTGAGGSIGSELCRQIAALSPATLLLADNSEHFLYTIHQELLGFINANGDQGFALVPLLVSVTDPKRIEQIITAWRPDCILHAAAYKHVPLVEHNPVEGVRNNVIGTWTVARLAQQHGVPNFVLISTDKAVRPTNVMGTSKRMAEMIVQALHDQGGQTRFAIVRFGNVLGSNGSVVPLFRRQIAQGGPVTITHPEIIRYFMTIPEAAQLVLQAGAMAAGGEVFVLDMGEPVKITDLARNMISLSGMSVRDDANPDGDIRIDFVGLRPGEKLYEELLIGEDAQPTSHPRILQANEGFLPWPVLGKVLANLIGALDAGDATTVRQLIKHTVPEYQPMSANVDLISLEARRAQR